MSEDGIQSIQLENSKLTRLLERLNIFISQRVELDRDKGIARITLEFNLKKSLPQNIALLFRRLAESTYIELFLLLVENSAIKYSILFSRLANSVFLLSRKVELDRDKGILRITLEFNLKKSLLFRKLDEGAYIELFLLLVENSAIKYSVLFSPLANSVFLLSRILERNAVNTEKLNSVVSNFYEALQVIRNVRRNITSKNVNDILVPLNKILDVVRNWSSDMFQSKPMLSKL